MGGSNPGCWTPWSIARLKGMGQRSRLRSKAPGKGCYIVQNAFWGLGPRGVFVRWSGRAIAKGRKKCFNVFRLIFCTFLEVAKKHPTATLFSRQLGQELDADFAVAAAAATPASCVLPPLKGLKNLFWFFSFRHFFMFSLFWSFGANETGSATGQEKGRKPLLRCATFFFLFKNVFFPFFPVHFRCVQQPKLGNGSRGGGRKWKWEWEWAERRLPGQM